MTLCDWIVLLELLALGIAGVRIWQLGRDRDRAVDELEVAEHAVDAQARTDQRVRAAFLAGASWMAGGIGGGSLAPRETAADEYIDRERQRTRNGN